MRSRAPFAGALAVGCLAASLAAPARAISPADAVRSTLDHQPAVALALAQLDERRGSAQQAAGGFDNLLFASSALNYNRQELIGSKLKEEQKRRIQLEVVNYYFDQVSRQLGDPDVGEDTLLFGGGNLLVGESCPFGQVEVQLNLGKDISGVDQGTTSFCLNNPNPAFGPDTIVIDGLDLGNCDPATAPPGAPCINLKSLSNLSTLVSLAELNVIGTFLEGPLSDTQKELNDFARIIQRIVNLVVEGSRFQLDRLGRVPVDEELIDMQAQVGTQFKFRNGAVLTPALQLQSSEANFIGKKRIVSYGDSSVPNFFNAAAILKLDLPLGKGQGRVSADARERASREAVSAAEALAVQTASDKALETLSAYWQLAAAQEKVAALEGSVRNKTNIRDATKALADADDVPKTDVTRAEAKLADATASLAAARKEMGERRVELARAMGVAADQVGTELVTEPLAAFLASDPIGELGESALVDHALATRSDVFAQDHLVSANQFLASGARADLKPQFDLSLNVSYSGLEEGFEDRFYDAEGFWKAASGRVAGPSYGISLKFKVPVGNNQARGRLLQAEANLGRTQIERTDLRRTVRLAVQQGLSQWRAARSELAARRDALDAQQQTSEAAFERMKAGDLGILDTLTTADQLTDARLSWIESARLVLDDLTRLRHDLHALLAFRGHAAKPGDLELVPLEQPIS